ncbi:MmpS family transport accessory protein [Mycobacterium sp. WMMD1722]|uniref:MmpS family transport accessory protein n=1 Tax=Mycobacterium sp. WMMD1722 TaxID=3404117 RepID=UPI003BF5EC38
MFRRLWIPLVIAVVIAAGGFTVSRLHGIFGSDTSLPYGDTAGNSSTAVNPKYLKYEVFGPAGTTAQISYFNENGDPQFLDGVPLPWSLSFPITGAAGVGSIAAQGDSESIGCRILVDDIVKAEKIATHEVSTFTSCLLKAA